MPGPTVDRCLAGARITEVYPSAPVMRGTPLSIALSSYGDSLGTDPDAIPAPARLATLLGREFASLGKGTARR
jgi:hypothetical protein